MRIRDYLYILSLVIIGVCWYHHAENDKAVWNLWDDPRACTIEWDDGTYSYKSRQVSLGTIGPGESKVVECDLGMASEAIDIDTNGITIVAFPRLLDTDGNVSDFYEKHWAEIQVRLDRDNTGLEITDCNFEDEWEFNPDRHSLRAVDGRLTKLEVLTSR